MEGPTANQGVDWNLSLDSLAPALTLLVQSEEATQDKNKSKLGVVK